MAETLKKEKSCGAVVFCSKDGNLSFLLVRQKNGFWSFPKGHMEAGETEQETALREIKEETGLDLELIEGFRATGQYDLAHEGEPEVIKQVVFFLAEYGGQDTEAHVSDVVDTQLMDYNSAISVLREEYRRILAEARDFINSGLII